MKRIIAAITGTRADYGIFKPIFQLIQESEDLELRLIVTGMHLSSEFGSTIKEIINDGFPIAAKIDMLFRNDSRGAMAKSCGNCLVGVTQALEEIKPHFLLVLGDRGEMLAGAISAAHLGIVVGHIHGGELSGSIDGSIRHAITKFAHLHFPVTEEAEKCLLLSGEVPKRIYKIGVPGLTGINEGLSISKSELEKRLKTKLHKDFILAVFHPVVGKEGNDMGQFESMLKALTNLGLQCILILPNSDAGRDRLLNILKLYEHNKNLHSISHIQREFYLALMKYASVMIGNSSSGIIEAPALGLPVVNIGYRQKGRLRGDNVIDVNGGEEEICLAIKKALNKRNLGFIEINSINTPYKKGDINILKHILIDLPIDHWLLEKNFTF